jgi:uncharacterized membrane protein YdcZ (DUF606 family)
VATAPPAEPLVVNTVIVLFGALGLWAALGAQTTFFPAGASWTLYLGGLFGFVIIAGLAFVFPKIGAAYAVALMVGGQCVAALMVDHFGLMGMPRDPLTIERAIGVALCDLYDALRRKREGKSGGSGRNSL